MRRKTKRAEEEAEINITPMLDIVFIMLIFFIVTTSFVKEVAVDASRPSNQPPKDAKMSQVIAVEIDQAGQVRVNKRLVDILAVRANIETGLAVKPDASVVIISHRDSDAGLVVRVIDQARVAGATKVSLAAPSS